ncbi:MAG: SdpI family protein [Niameybacter sp.]
MMKTKNPIIKSILILAVVSILATLYFYNQLPTEVPIHFNYAGTPDGYGPRIFVFFTAALPILMLGFLKVVPKLDPKGDAYVKHAKVYNIFIIFLIIMLLALHWVTMSISLGVSLSINKITPPLIGLLFIVIGNYMPQIKQNYTFGIKLPWTYNDEDNWRATHRMGGYCYVLSGICFIISAFVPTGCVAFMSVIALGCLLLPMIYSYFYFRKHTVKKH